MNRRLPKTCPSCAHNLHVKTMKCDHCGTQIDGAFNLPALGMLSEEDQEFILNFVKTSGSLKQMAKAMGLSYPTVRNRLDELIERIQATEAKLSNGGTHE